MTSAKVMADKLLMVFAEYDERFRKNDKFRPEQPLCERCKSLGIHSCDCDRNSPMWNQTKP